MFTVSNDQFPQRNEVQNILNKIYHEKKLPESIENHQSKKEIDELKEEIQIYINSLDIFSNKDENEVKEICVKKFLKSNPLSERNFVFQNGDVLLIVPTGLLAMSFFSKKQIKKELDTWLKSLKSLRGWKFSNMESNLKRENKNLSEKIYKLEKVIDRKTVEMIEAREERDRIHSCLNKLGSLEPIYKRRNSDPTSIPGLKGIHEKRYNHITEMSELIQKGIEYTCQDLDKISGSHGKSLYNIGKSSEIAYGPSCQAHRTAIVCFFVYKLLCGSSLKSIEEIGVCHGDPRVVLNDQDLFIQWSHPVRVQLDQSGSTSIVFLNPNEWAMTPSPIYFPEGIDPVSAKLILNRMSDNEKLHLRRLILDPFMEMGPELRQAYAYRDQENERSILVRDCYNLIHTMATALNQSFQSQIGFKLLEFFDEDTQPFIRAEVIPQAVVEEEKYLDWEPNMEYFPRDLRPIIQKRERQLKIISDHMSKDLLQSGGSLELKDNEILNSQQFKEQLSNHYYIKHNFGWTSCRIDTLATLIYQDGKKEFNKSWSIMKVIANYLKNNRGQFEEQIANKGFTLDEVIRQYERQGKSLLQDDLEIEIAAHALGITIGLFVPNAPVRKSDSGLIEPTVFLGPKTKQRLYVLSDGGHSFYALEPKYISPDDNSALSEAINEYAHYWREGTDDEQRFMNRLGFN